MRLAVVEALHGLQAALGQVDTEIRRGLDPDERALALHHVAQAHGTLGDLEARLRVRIGDLVALDLRLRLSPRRRQKVIAARRGGGRAAADSRSVRACGD